MELFVLLIITIWHLYLCFRASVSTFSCLYLYLQLHCLLLCLCSLCSLLCLQSSEKQTAGSLIPSSRMEASYLPVTPWGEESSVESFIVCNGYTNEEKCNLRKYRKRWKTCMAEFCHLSRGSNIVEFNGNNGGNTMHNSHNTPSCSSSSIDVMSWLKAHSQ